MRMPALKRGRRFRDSRTDAQQAAASLDNPLNTRKIETCCQPCSAAPRYRLGNPPSACPMVRRRTFPQHGRFINKQKGWPDQPDRWAASLIQTALSLTDAEAAPQIPRL